MARNPSTFLRSAINWTCHQCRTQTTVSKQHNLSRIQHQGRAFSTTIRYPAEAQIQSAPEIDFEQPTAQAAARILPSSPSYFTAAPAFTDHILLLQDLLRRHGSLPSLSPEAAPRLFLKTLTQYRSQVGEKVPSSKYAQALVMIRRLNQIQPALQPSPVKDVIELFRRPGTAQLVTAKPGQIDEYGRAKGVGRRKASSARVYLVEGTGEILINGRSLVDMFPRLHDRESALWPLTITERVDKYNVFALVEGGGTTGQAESITLALAKALLIHEPALKPALRRAGCVTRIMKRVERKKPGHLKARKKPTWVKR